MNDNLKIGERKIIELFYENITKNPNFLYDDDVSSIKINDNLNIVFNSDMLIEKTDIPKDMGLFNSGRKAVIMNISDFASKGIKPLAFLSSVGIPKSYNINDLQTLSKGINSGANEYGTYIAGGDTNESDSLIINIAGFGLDYNNSLIPRKGAQTGDVLAVTGLFGNTTIGLMSLTQNIPLTKNISDVFVESVYSPNAKLKEGLLLSKLGIATSSIDSSDGLAHSLGELSRINNIGFEIDFVPITKDAYDYSIKNNYQDYKIAFYGGEEYEIIFTVSEQNWNIVKNTFTSNGMDLYKIGKVIKANKIILSKNNVVVAPTGWEHFV